MENKPILSICIPTYNREKYLKECIDSIVLQEWFNETDIEIVISDNASVDNTTELVREYQAKYSNIVYFRNEENIGAIKNILKLPNYANGDYIWFLSDDDMASNIAVNTILEVIKNDRPWLILSKFFWFWNWENIDQTKINRSWNIFQFIWMEDFFNFLWTVKYDITPYIMLLSVFCFKKGLYLSNFRSLLDEKWDSYLVRLNNDNFVHSRIIFIPFWNSEKITIIEKDLVLCRWNNISWNFKFIVCQDLLRLIKDLKRTYEINRVTYRKMMGVYYYSVFTYVIISHVQKYMPKFLYDLCISTWRKVIMLLRKVNEKLG